MRGLTLEKMLWPLMPAQCRPLALKNDFWIPVPGQAGGAPFLCNTLHKPSAVN